MILHSIELENFGRFVEPALFEFSPDRVNLLSGPNGSGKSTVLAGLSAAFVIPHRSANEDIRRWQPWDRDLAPRVTVEFTSSGVRYRLSKTFTFSSRAKAALERFEADRFVPVCEADAVERRIPEFLGGKTRPGVDARTREWLIAGVLWARQNGLADLQAGAAVQDAVRLSLGAQARSGLLASLTAEVRRLYEKDWTPTGRLAKTSEVTSLSAAVAEIEEQAEALRGGLEALEALRSQLYRLQIQELELDAQFTTSESELRPLGEQRKQQEQLLQRQTACRQEKQVMEQESRRLQLVLSARSSHAGRAQAAAQKRQQAEAALSEARERLARAEAASRAAREHLAAETAGLEAAIRHKNAPPPQTLSRLESLAAQQRELEARLEGALLHAEILPERDFRLEVLQGEPQGPLEAKAGQPLRISGSPVIELRVPGTGSFLLSGPAQSAEEIRGKLAEVQAQWQRATAPYGTDSLEELKRRRAEADQMELELDRLKEQARQHDAGRSETAQAVKEARAGAVQWEKTLHDAESALRALEEERLALQTEPMDDPQIRARLDELALKLRGVEQELAQIAEQLAAFPADLEQRFEQQMAATSRFWEQWEQTGRDIERTRLRLAEQQGAANYSALAEKQAELEEKRRLLAAAQLRANANKLLHDTLRAVIEEAEAQVLPLLERRATKLYNEIASGFADAISLEGKTWLPAGVQPAGGAGRVSPGEISGGEQEQLHLAVRLALADILTEKEPFPVVLDDVLLATDDTRLGRILEMLEARKQKMQFLILTCHPERFRELSATRLIRLDSRGAAA